MSQPVRLQKGENLSQKPGDNSSQLCNNYDEYDRRQRLKALNKSSIFESSFWSKYSAARENAVSEQSTITSQNGSMCAQRDLDRGSRHLKVASQVTALRNSVGDDSVFYSAQHEEVLLTARGLCRDYICYRLKRSGFRGRVVITKYSPAKDQNLSFDILKMGKTFEDLYPHLFRNLARQLGYVLRTDAELRLLFDRLGTEIMGPNSEEYRWGRILALLGVAGSLSVDCMLQGHIELVENMVTIFCDFVELKLLNWMVDHGGWESMGRIFSVSERPRVKRSLVCRSNQLFATAIAVFVVFGIVFSMSSVSRAILLREQFF